MLFKFILAVLSLGMLVSCSKFGRLDKGAGTKVTFNRGSQNGVHGLVGPVQEGGIMIWGVSPTNGQTISFLLPRSDSTTESLSRDFPNGDWNFYAVSWLGPSELQGAARCASVPVTLTGGSKTVDIALSTDCSDDFFGDDSYLNANSFKPLTIEGCAALPSSYDGDLSCSAENLLGSGAYGSYKVVVGGHNEFSAIGAAVEPSPGHTLTSGCKIVSTGKADTTLELPVGNGGTSPIYVEIQGYSGPSCGTLVGTHVFYHGLYPGETASGQGAAYVGTSPVRTVSHLITGTVPNPDINDTTPADRVNGGWGGGFIISVYGSNFMLPEVTVGDLPCEVFSWTPSTIDCYVDGHITDKAQLGAAKNIVVTNANGVDDTATGNFAFVDDGFGNAADSDDIGGEYVVDSSITDTSVAAFDGSSKIFAANRNVTNITISGSTSTLTLSSAVTANDFEVGDEIMWHVSAASGDSDCHASELPRNKLGFARVTSASGNSMTIDAAISSTTPTNANISAASRQNNQTFCVIQIVRVPNFKDLTIDTTAGSVVIKPPPFSLTTGQGGILAIRVSDTYSVTGPNIAAISATGKGFAGGLAGFQGSSRRGQGLASTAPVGHAGGAGASGAPSTGAGGGGAEAGGGDGGADTNGGPFATTGCLPVQASPCAGMGAGGGGGAVSGAGGPGGGIALLFARDTDSSSAINVEAKGMSGGTDLNGGGGGGAGGTVLIQSEGSSSEDTDTNVTGGSGGASTAGSSDSGGGGGSGGTSQVRYCSTTAFATVSVLTDGGPGGFGTNASGTSGGNGLTTPNRDVALGDGVEFCSPYTVP